MKQKEVVEWKSIVLPHDGIGELMLFIASARETIDGKFFKLQDPLVIDGLIMAHAKGVHVRVMLNAKRSDGSRVNDHAFDTLQAAGVDVRWTNPLFVVSHEKSILVDQKKVLVGTFNTCTACFVKVRDYALITNDSVVVDEFHRCFQADWDEMEFIPAPESPLLWSNVNSRKKTIEFIDSAQKTLDVQHPKLVDASILDRLLAAHFRGVRVRFLCGGGSGLSHWDFLECFSAWRILVRCGIRIRHQKKPKLHAKLIVADEKSLLVSSFNLDRSAFDLRREVGLITSHPQAVERLHAQFHADWKASRLYQVPEPMEAFALSAKEKDVVPEMRDD